jgi:hypothetical protein
MKVTANWVLQHFPFLAGLMQTGNISGKQKISLKIKPTAIELHKPPIKNAQQFFDAGLTTGISLANCNKTTPPIGEMAAGQVVNSGFYYAILDVHVSAGMRELTIFFNPADLIHATQELRNQLASLNLKLATAT